MQVTPEGMRVTSEGASAQDQDTLDKVLVAVGRRPNGAQVDADQAGVQVDDRGFIPVDSHMRTNVAHIYAIGDVVGQPMLAHKATHEARVAAEASAGHNAHFDARVIPSVAYTDPVGAVGRAVGDQTLHPLSVRRRVGSVRGVRGQPAAVGQSNPMSRDVDHDQD